MTDTTPSSVKFDRRLNGESIDVAGWRIQPVVRWVGWEMYKQGEEGQFSAQAGRLTPLELRIEGDERQETRTLDDPLQGPMRAIVAFGLAVSLLSLLITAAAQVTARHR